jgi:hypothetical protein
MYRTHFPPRKKGHVLLRTYTMSYAPMPSSFGYHQIGRRVIKKPNQSVPNEPRTSTPYIGISPYSATELEAGSYLGM